MAVDPTNQQIGSLAGKPTAVNHCQQLIVVKQWSMMVNHGQTWLWLDVYLQLAGYQPRLSTLTGDLPWLYPSYKPRKPSEWCLCFKAMTWNPPAIGAIHRLEGCQPHLAEHRPTSRVVAGIGIGISWRSPGLWAGALMWTRWSTDIFAGGTWAWKASSAISQRDVSWHFNVSFSLGQVGLLEN